MIEEKQDIPKTVFCIKATSPLNFTCVITSHNVEFKWDPQLGDDHKRGAYAGTSTAGMKSISKIKIPRLSDGKQVVLRGKYLVIGFWLFVRTRNRVPKETSKSDPPVLLIASDAPSILAPLSPHPPFAVSGSTG